MDPYRKFKEECAQEIERQSVPEVWEKLHNFIFDPRMAKYVYHFEWLGRPVIQVPQDMVQIQELIWRIKPDLIIETGIAHGGSLMLSASILALLELAEATEKNTLLDPNTPKRYVAGIDIDIRKHNRTAIESHPMAPRIVMFEGSSIAESTANEVKKFASGFNTVLVLLDSNHTHEHVLEELNLYANLVSVGSYCIVFDTIVDDIGGPFPGRPWGAGNNPKTAVHEFIQNSENFVIDHAIQNKLLWTAAPDGYLLRVK